MGRGCGPEADEPHQHTSPPPLQTPLCLLTFIFSRFILFSGPNAPLASFLISLYPCPSLLPDYTPPPSLSCLLSSSFLSLILTPGLLLARIPPVGCSPRRGPGLPGSQGGEVGVPSGHICTICVGPAVHRVRSSWESVGKRRPLGLGAKHPVTLQPTWTIPCLTGCSAPPQLLLHRLRIQGI